MPATRYGISPWMEHAPRPRPAAAPAFKGEVDAPLVIIGGGLTGVITAWACAQAGMKALLLDADRLGRGGTSLGSGLSPSTPGLSFREFSATAGRRAARAHFEQTAEAAADFTSTLRRLNRKVALETVDAWQVALFGQGAASLTAEAAARTDADLTASIKTAAAAQTATRLSVSAGVRVPGWITANPLDVLHAFATAATKKGVQIFERSPVTRIGFDRRLATVHTARGRITTTCVIHATGEPGPLSASLHRHFTPSLRPVVMTAAVPASARRILLRDDVVLIDDEAPAHAIRWTKDGRLMVSGADGARPAAAKNEAFLVQRTGQLMYELSRLYPDISGLQPARGWATPLSAFADAGVCAGPHRNFPHQLFGFAGNHDPVRAFLIARTLARHATGRAAKADALIGCQRGSHR